jgi:nitrite reductase/ring-hydroxylating ferredoxin subunit
VLTAPAPTLDAVFAAAREFARDAHALLAAAGETVELPLYLSAVASVDALEARRYDFRLRVRLAARGASVLRVREDAPPRPPYLELIATASVLQGFCRGDVSLDALLLSGRARFHRDPDTFHAVLHNVLRFGRDPDAAAALVAWTRAARAKVALETVTRVVDGEPRVLPRYCPHEGEDLAGVAAVDGRLTCPRHKWCFDLRTGQCTTGDRTVNLYALVRAADADARTPPR